MRLFIYIFIVILIVLRYSISKKRKQETLHFLLFSGIIQCLMTFPIIFSPLIVVDQKSYEYFGAPFEKSIGLLFPTILTFVLSLVCKKSLMSFRYILKDVKFPLFSIGLAFIYSYVTPYNLSHKATTLALIMFIQIFYTVYVCKKYLEVKIVIHGVYDAFRIIVFIEFLIAFSYSMLGIDFIQNLFVGEDSEWIREGTNIRRAYGTTFQPNRLGGLCAYIFVFFFSCFLMNFKKKYSLICVILSFVVILLSQSRMALMATTVSSISLYMIVSYKKGKLSFKWIVSSAIFGLILLLFMLNSSIIANMIFKSDAEEMENARLVHYVMGFMVLEQTRFQGVGLNSHVFYMADKLNLAGIGEFYYTRPIHSVHLSIFVETGLIGFITWIWYFISRNVKLLKLNLLLNNNNLLSFTHVGMLIVVFIHGFADNVYIHYQYLMMLFLVGSFVKYKNNRKQPILTCCKKS